LEEIQNIRRNEIQEALLYSDQYKVTIKVKFTLEQATKAQRGAYV
jgi:hypothetical protein